MESMLAQASLVVLHGGQVSIGNTDEGRLCEEAEYSQPNGSDMGARAQYEHQIRYRFVLQECMASIQSRYWPVERSMLGLPDPLEEEALASTDVEVWGATELVYLEKVWRKQIREAILRSAQPSPRQLALVCASSATFYVHHARTSEYES